MTLVLNATTAEGIVIAADSRQSYRNQKGMARIGSDNASKLFQINRRIGVAVTGLAFLPDENNVAKNISKFIEEFKHDPKNQSKDLNVKEVTEKLYELFNNKYKWKEQLEQLKQNFKSDLKAKGCNLKELKQENNILKFRFKNPQGNIEENIVALDIIEILVAGYNKNSSHNVYSFSIPGEIKLLRDSNQKNNEYGSSWLGQVDVVSRIILGYDGRIVNVPFVKDAIITNGNELIFKQLQGLQYSIQWGIMTLQDAMDYSKLMIQTTSAIQRFSDGINADPGDMPGVGGPIDMAVITPDKGFVWINKKKLKFDDTIVDLEKQEDLKHKSK
jgi:20S proteasome alpha/beta subunit